MNALGLVEQESGRAVGFYCGECGRAQLPHHCHETPTVVSLTELHRKAEACCTTSRCPRHDYVIMGWHQCLRCLQEGPEGRDGEPPPAPVDVTPLRAAPGERAQ
jgi:hypothetical protein